MKPLYVILLCLCSQYLAAQLYDKTWICGYGSKIVFGESSIDTIRVSPTIGVLSQWAIISDGDGVLNFFTEGMNVYSSDGIKMPNGIQLADNEVNADFPNGLPDDQNVLILPKRDKQYYIVYQSQSDFSYANEPWYYTDNLYYSVVDMEQQGGKGDVTQKRVLVNSNRFMDGKMTACQHANGRDWWLVQRRYNANSYFIYLVTPDGITFKSEQFIGAVSSEPDAIGQSAFSPDGTKLLAASEDGSARMWDVASGRELDEAEAHFAGSQADHARAQHTRQRAQYRRAERYSLHGW